MKKLLLLSLLLLISACDMSQDEHTSNDWWCNFYGTCTKNETPSCSLYGNCPKSNKDKTKETDIGCSLYGRCEDENSNWW